MPRRKPRGRVLSRTNRLGETSRVAKGHKLLMGGLVACPPPPASMFWNEYALRCNLVHFETQF